ncbi:hypothetical protein AURDEDRAFT_188145 [Auricularia subglabra TFB-10046 SS5]|uniref:Uncharacterized protein n=1 Tax=Auricularia subglabra (strain TFB-10046 / SS5) TaxID=717982 RepID=J0LH94_AURST|nr:hypothetical protein AURDEDRAFT_188145 [Auricularia subglabra TFB-10046 SS5]
MTAPHTQKAPVLRAVTLAELAPRAVEGAMVRGPTVGPALCTGASAADRRRRPEADSIEKANVEIVRLENENQQLRDIIRRHGIDLSKELEEAPRLTITVEDASQDVGMDGGVGYYPTPLTPASSDSSWSVHSPWSGSSALPSPLPSTSQPFLEVPMGAHGRTGYNSEDEGGHMGLAHAELYGNPNAMIDRQDGSQASTAMLSASSSWVGLDVPASPGGMSSLSVGLAAISFRATDRQGATDMTLSYPNAGPELLTVGPELAVQGSTHAFGFPASNFDVDAGTSMLFAGSSMNVPPVPFEGAYRNDD